MTVVRRKALQLRRAIRRCFSETGVRAFGTAQGSDTAVREKNVVYSSFPSVELPEGGIASHLFKRAARWSNKDAVECGLTGRKYTYGGMIDRAMRWADVVNKVMPPTSENRNLMYISPNVPEFPIVFCGTQSVGATFVTCNHSYKAAEIARQLSDSEAKMVVVDPQLEGVVRTALESLNKSLPVFANGVSEFGSPNLREIIEDKTKPFAEVVEVTSDAMSTILYSSGTTGKPKGVAIKNRALTANLAMFDYPGLMPYLPTTEEYQDNVIGLMPFYHVYGFCLVAMNTLHRGAKMVTLPAFIPKEFIRVMTQHKVGVLHLVPPILNFLTASPAVEPSYLTHVRSVLITGAPVSPTIAVAFKQKAPNPVVFQEGYGMTEILGSHLTPLKEEKIGWCGKLAPNVAAKVIDLTSGEAQPEGQRGELCLRAPTMMSHYYNNPEATAETIDKEGWLHTGDVAIHEDGFFSIVDRIKELIKVKGYQVSPSELEDELLKHPGVMDVGVVGIEDERAGELPRAYVVRKPETTEEDLMGYLKDRLADYKQLKGGIKFVESLPKNATGKLLRRQLKEMAASDP